MYDSPIVSVGIPTYNRAVGLRNTLTCITGQTYKNLEIIISDNASTDLEVGTTIQEFLMKDNRIKYYRQGSNIGPALNFKFVLKKAQGHYFMWAADDDEWDFKFIEECLFNIGNSVSVMTSLEVLYRKSKKIIPIKVPYLNQNNSKYINAKLFLTNCISSLIYGIHNTKSIQYFLEDDIWDYYDCFFVLKQILHGGFLTLPDKTLYRAGVDTMEYTLKPFKSKKGRVFEYLPFYKKCSKEILSTKGLSVFEKFSLLRVLTNFTCNSFITYENSVRPKATRFISLIRRLIN